MSTVEQFIDALAMVESSNNPSAWGDGGRAMGRWQIHPDAMWSWCRILMIQPHLEEPWDIFVKRIVSAMVLEYQGVRSMQEMAMRWHLGHWSSPDLPEWDREYENKFNFALSRALGASIT